MAEVFLAKAAGPKGFEKTLVLKRILPHLAEDQHFVEMFLAEAKIAAQLNHPNIVQVYDFGEAEGAYYIAMEYVDGPNLRLIIRQTLQNRTQLPIPLCIKLVSMACEGLAYAHEFTDPQTGSPLGLIHCDISPENMLLSRNGSVKVVDFGIAKAAGFGPQSKAGTFKGKVSYMPPERIQGNPFDLRADIFSLGVVLYELVTGMKPFNARTDVSILHAILQEPMVPISSRRPDVPDLLGRILARALAKDPDNRYRSCRELQRDLDRFLVSIGKAVSSHHLSRLVSYVTDTTLKLTGAPTAPSLENQPRAISGQPTSPRPEPPVIFRAVNSPRTGQGNEDSAVLEASPPELLVPPPLKRILGALDDLGVQLVHLPRRAWIVAAVIAILLALGVVSYGYSRRAGTDTPGVVPVAVPKSESSASAGSGAPNMSTPAVLAAGDVKSTGLASFELESSPPGLVRVNGKLVGTSPVRLEDQLPGSVRVEVYDTAKAFSRMQTFELSPGDNGTKRVVIEEGVIEFRIRPYAMVWLDGKQLGVTPFPAVPAYEGHHAVHLVNRKINKNVILDFEVKAGQPNIFKYNLND